MVVGALCVEFHLPDSSSLKDKRSVVKSLKDRVGHRFNVAVVEVDSNTMWERASLGIAAVADEGSAVDQILDAVVRYLREDRMVALIRVEKERW